MPAPARPPLSACDAAAGRPPHPVSRFHTIAPARPEITTHTIAWSLGWIVTIFASVFATPSWKMNSATKLNTVAHSTARRGDGTRVDTTEANEFAASWNPL